MREPLFHTWDGDDSTLVDDLSQVLAKHNALLEGASADKLAEFLSETVSMAQDADGSSSEFTTSMFILYKESGFARQLGTRKARH